MTTPKKDWGRHDGYCAIILYEVGITSQAQLRIEQNLPRTISSYPARGEKLFTLTDDV